TFGNTPGPASGFGIVPARPVEILALEAAAPEIARGAERHPPIVGTTGQQGLVDRAPRTVTAPGRGPRGEQPGRRAPRPGQRAIVTGRRDVVGRRTLAPASHDRVPLPPRVPRRVPAMRGIHPPPGRAVGANGIVVVGHAAEPVARTPVPSPVHAELHDRA